MIECSKEADCAKEILDICELELLAAELCPECFLKEQDRAKDDLWFVKACRVIISRFLNSFVVDIFKKYVIFFYFIATPAPTRFVIDIQNFNYDFDNGLNFLCRRLGENTFKPKLARENHAMASWPGYRHRSIIRRLSAIRHPCVQMLLVHQVQIKVRRVRRLTGRGF